MLTPPLLSRFVLTSLLILGLLVPAGQALAIERTFGFTMSIGLFLDNAGQVTPAPPIGSVMTGSFNFEDSIGDSDPNPNAGLYLDSILCAEASFGASNEHFFLVLLDASPSGEGDILVEDDVLDRYNGSLVSDVAVLNGPLYEEGDFAWVMQAFPSSTAITSPNLPTTPPNPAAFNAGTSITVNLNPTAGGPNPVSISGTILTLTSSPTIPCPEPGIATLLVPGVMALLVVGRRSRVRARVSA